MNAKKIVDNMLEVDRSVPLRGPEGWRYRRSWWVLSRPPFEFKIWDSTRWLDDERAREEMRLLEFRIKRGRQTLYYNTWSLRLKSLPTFENLLAYAKERSQNSATGEAARILYPEAFNNG